MLLVVVVDQLASWVMEERLASLSASGGFAKLLRDGLYAPELRYEHATTSTAPGHAALYSGLPPRESGVFANERLDDKTNKPVSVFADPGAREVLDTVTDSTSSSAAQLHADVLADALRAQHPDAKIISISLKDRAVIPGGGRKPDAAVWYDHERGAFVTSSAFASELPTWALAQNQALGAALAGRWQPLDPSWLAEHAPTPDAQPGEGDFGLGVVFPYDLAGAKNRAKVFRGYPAADRAVLDMARGAVRALDGAGQSKQRLLLSLSLSALDYVGHVHGPDSWESWEALRELDAELARLFAELEQRYGDRLSILLSADHGTTPLPETADSLRARPWCRAGAAPDRFERPCVKGERLYRDELEQRLRKAAEAALGKGEWIRGVIEPFVYFTPAALALPPARRAALEQASVDALQQHPGIARALVTRKLPAPCAPTSDESIEALVCRSLPDAAGELYVVTRAGSFFDPNLVRGHGINHGTPYLFDRAVPLFVYGAARRRVGARSTERLRPADFTATAAALLGISPPAGAATGRDLSRL